MYLLFPVTTAIIVIFAIIQMMITKFLMLKRGMSLCLLINFSSLVKFIIYCFHHDNVITVIIVIFTIIQIMGTKFLMLIRGMSLCQLKNFRLLLHSLFLFFSLYCYIFHFTFYISLFTVITSIIVSFIMIQMTLTKLLMLIRGK